MMEWTHKYRYKIKHSYNQIVTGVLQVGGYYSPTQILKLAKKMNNSIKNDACLLDFKLIARKG